MERWWIKKHKNYIRPTELNSGIFCKKIIRKELYSEIYTETEVNNISVDTIIDWKRVSPMYRLHYYYENYEKELTLFLKDSQLGNSETIFFDIESSLPIFKTETRYYFNNWVDFEMALSGNNGIVFTEGFQFFMEFTGNPKRFLFSNFPIFPDSRSIV